jgi:hypothetical protein
MPLVLLPTLVIWFRDHMPAWLFMWSLAFAIFSGLKWITWWKARNRVPHSLARSVAYLAAWPGMDAEAFLDSRRNAPRARFGEWLWALSKALFGAALLWQVARLVPEAHPLVRGWLGLLGLIFLLHFGSFHAIALLANPWCRRRAHYVEANLVEDFERVLGQAVEPRFSSACL